MPSKWAQRCAFMWDGNFGAVLAEDVYVALVTTRRKQFGGAWGVYYGNPPFCDSVYTVTLEQAIARYMVRVAESHRVLRGPAAGSTGGRTEP